MSSSVTTKDELMAEVENETRQLKKKEFFPYKIMGTLIFSLLLSIVIEWGALPFNIGFSSEFQKKPALQCAGIIY